jgi:hypothetical protein
MNPQKNGEKESGKGEGGSSSSDGLRVLDLPFPLYPVVLLVD